MPGLPTHLLQELNAGTVVALENPLSRLSIVGDPIALFFCDKLSVLWVGRWLSTGTPVHPATKTD